MEVDVIEKIIPIELKLILALDFCKRSLEVVHVIEQKGIQENDPADNIEILKFNSLDKIEQIFFKFD